MPDPGQISSQFLAGPQLDSTQLDVDADLIPYFWWNPNLVNPDGSTGGYIESVVSPADLYTAMSA